MARLLLCLAAMRGAPLLLGVVVAACGPTEVGGDGQTTDGGVDRGSVDARQGPRPSEFADAAPADSCSAMDIVFVIDNSGSMADEQNNLRANFPGFVSILDGFTSDGGAPVDYRVAVTSTGVTKSWTGGFPTSQTGDDGAFRSGCGTPRPWLERGDPDLAGSFACMAELGTGGPLYEMPLEAAYLGLSARMSDGANTGFRRDDALLAIIVITDEDDCSRRDDGFSLGLFETPCTTPEPVTSYLGLIDGLAGGRERWALAVIAGTEATTCTAGLGSAQPATRLMDLTQMAGTNAVASSICNDDLASPLAEALATFDAACNSFPDVD